MSRAWADRTGYRRYRANRAAILAANGMENRGLCTLQIQGVCTGAAEEVHHVKGKQYGDDPKWMVPSCKACNLHVGQPGRGNVEPKRVSNW